MIREHAMPDGCAARMSRRGDRFLAELVGDDGQVALRGRSQDNRQLAWEALEDALENRRQMDQRIATRRRKALAT